MPGARPSPERRDGRAGAEAWLRGLAGVADNAIDLAEAALRLAVLDRPGLALEPYREHLETLVARTRAQAGDAADSAARLGALAAAIYDEAGYDGDRVSYDDLHNADLTRVIDRRRGLPVTLAIVVIHVARALGWHAEGVNFPGHFLVRLRGDPPVIVDPFERVTPRGPAELRALLKAVAGSRAELGTDSLATAGNRDILLRLQGNIRLRLLHGDDLTGARDVSERMIWIAPDDARLWREYGQLEARLGHRDLAVAALETALARAASEKERQRAAALLREVDPRRS